MGKNIFSVLMGIIGVVGAFYIIIWWGIVEPIIHVASLIDANALTAMAVAYELLKFLFKGFLGGVWAIIFFALAGLNFLRG